MQLRPYQLSMVQRAREAMRASRRVLLVAPTGAGKTVVLAYVANRVTERRKHAAILVHRRELLEQAGAKLRAFGIPHGYIVAEDRAEARERIVVASVQTLARRLDVYRGRFDLLVIDEAHHAVAGQWRQIIESCPDAYLLGVTATPERLDGRGLGDMFDTLVEGPTVAELIRDGYLARYTAYTTPDPPDLSQVRLKLGDFDQAMLLAAMSKPAIVGDAVEHYRRLADRRPALVFCVSVKHAELVAEAFRAGGYRAASVDGTLEMGERKRRLAGLANGSLHVLTSCELVSEGLDIPGIAVAILLRPTQSLGLCLQQIGRALRPKDDDSKAIILDHAGNIGRHGLPDARREWRLMAQRRSRDQAQSQVQVRVCMDCYAVSPGRTQACEQCGHVFPVISRPGPRNAKGELVLAEDRPARPKIHLSKDELSRALAECKSFRAVQELGKSLGYDGRWAWFAWKKKRPAGVARADRAKLELELRTAGR